MAGLRQLSAGLRANGYANRVDGAGKAKALARLALGAEVPLADLEGVAVGPLVDAGGADVDAEGSVIRLRFGVMAAGQVLVVVPLADGDDDRIYIDRDSLWLIDDVWRHTAPGRVAVELGAGAGLLAAGLLQRFDTVVATDVLPRTAAAAALTLTLNDTPGRRALACVADVVGGLRPGAFDLVAANAPWVPGSTGRIFADGGPTGFELPRRFLLEGSRLLAPGGVLLVMCLDLVHRRRPDPLGTVRAQLEDQGYATAVRLTPAATEWPELTEAAAANPDIERCQHVIVEVRQAGAEGARPAVTRATSRTSRPLPHRGQPNRQR